MTAKLSPEVKRATVQTTDATVTSLLTYAMADNTTAIFEARVTGDVNAGANSAGYIRQSVYKRTGGGAATIVGAQVLALTAEDNAAWDCTIDTDGANTVRVRVTGAAATTVDWMGRLIIDLYTP